MMKKYKTIEITKTVPVADLESLKAWLNKELADWVSSGKSDAHTAGTKALDLIEEAGFKLTPPTVSR